MYLNDLPDAARVLAKLPQWFEDYNRFHPHKGLRMKSPWEYRQSMEAAGKGKWVVSGLLGATTRNTSHRAAARLPCGYDLCALTSALKYLLCLI